MERIVFISHGWHDRWIAKQMARLVGEAGAVPFVDVFDIKKGDRIESRVKQGIRGCHELVALITPWSVDRKWVWSEISGVWAHDKRITAVFYGISMREVEDKHGGLACIGPTNVSSIDEFDQYLAELTERVKLGSD